MRYVSLVLPNIVTRNRFGHVPQTLTIDEILICSLYLPQKIYTCVHSDVVNFSYLVELLVAMLFFGKPTITQLV
jgi:hypothetical protein